MPSEDIEALRAKWNQRYRDAAQLPLPARVLTDNVHLLPKTGQSLDFACGLGANALFLGKRGLDVTAWDLSPVAIEKLRATASERGLNIRAETRDLQAEPPPANSYDLIVVSHFLDRNLVPTLIEALRPGGLIFYQTFTRDALEGPGPGNPNFRLAPNELLHLFGALRLLYYREDGRVGDTEQGERNLAFLVAQRLP